MCDSPITSLHRVRQQVLSGVTVPVGVPGVVIYLVVTHLEMSASPLLPCYTVGGYTVGGTWR